MEKFRPCLKLVVVMLALAGFGPAAVAQDVMGKATEHFGLTELGILGPDSALKDARTRAIAQARTVAAHACAKGSIKYAWYEAFVGRGPKISVSCRELPPAPRGGWSDVEECSATYIARCE